MPLPPYMSSVERVEFVSELECLERIVDRYHDLANEPRIQAFRKGGGRLDLASEGRSVEEILALRAAGHQHFAEKFAQELATKRRHLSESSYASDLEFTFFGHLQRNKAPSVLRISDRIESLDRTRLITRILGILDRGGKPPQRGFLIQINIGKEPQKSGVLPEEADLFIEQAILANLPILGIMGIPPKMENPLPYFRRLRGIADRNRLPECQMGMSSDWPMAIDEGATAIRIGRAVFGTIEPVQVNPGGGGS